MEIENFLKFSAIVLAFFSNFLYLREMFGFKRKLWLFPFFWGVYEAAFQLLPVLQNSTPWVNVTLNWLHLLFMAWFFCKGTWKKRLVLSSVYILLVLFFEPFLTILIIKSGAVGSIEEIFANPKLVHTICNIEWIAMIGITQIISIITKNRLHKATGKRHGMGVLMISVSCIIASFIQCAGIVKNNNITWSSLLVIILILVVSLMCYYFFLVGEDKSHLEMEYKVYEEQVKLYSQWMEEQKQSQSVMASFRHDMKNHIVALKGICSRNAVGEETEGLREINKYLDSIGTNYQIGNAIVNSGNVLLDAILNMKLNYALSQEIFATAEVTVPRDLMYDSLDMVIVLGNLLDNAIEGCETVVGERKLHIQVKYDKGNLFIAMENSYSGIYDGSFGLLSEEKFPKSTKKDKKSRGIGMRSVAGVVNKYHGELCWRAEQKVFYTEVLLYQLEQKNSKSI